MVDSMQPDVACRAPFTSLYLDQRGYAKICALTSGMPLGSVATTPLLDLWRGPVAAEWRARFADGAISSFCHICKWQTDSGSGDAALARVYDEMQPAPDLAWPTHMEFALGNHCNLQCIQCSGEQSSAIRAHREGFPALPDVFDDRFFADLAEILPHLEAAKFLGGEPLLVPAHQRVWDLMIEADLDTPIHITTNGTVWNRRVERVLEQFPTSLAVSMDGIRPETVEAIRVGARYDVVRANLDRFLAYTRDRGTHLGLTYCLMRPNVEEFGDFLLFADDQGVDAWVNLVALPARLSLVRLPTDELKEIVRGLEAQDGELRGRLGRNRHVWEEQLSQLQTTLERPHDGPEGAWLRPTAVRLGEPPAATEEVTESDRRELEAWADGGPVAIVDMDDRDRVVAVDPPADGFLELPLSIVGLGLDEVASLLSSFHGRQTEFEWLERSPELEDRRALHETLEDHTELRSITRGAGPGRARMTVASRTRPGAPPTRVQVVESPGRRR